MSRKTIDLSGQRFGRLTVTGEAPKLPTNPKRRWYYVCDCGQTGTSSQFDLRSGKSTSCGCYRVERSTRHGMARSGTYSVWTSMIQRCTREHFPKYKYYGGRGITVCARWREDFVNFLADMGEQPAPRWSIDRIDVNGNYEPGNCRWVTMQQQQLNRRNNRRVTYRGREQTVKEWCDELGLDEELIRGRLKHPGWTPKALFETPAMSNDGSDRTDPTTGRFRRLRQ